MPPIVLTAEQFQRISRALSDATRYEMLRRIYAEDDQTCGNVCDQLPVTAGTASHHFRELEEAELIHVTKCGRYRKLTARRDIWEAYVAQLAALNILNRSSVAPRLFDDCQSIELNGRRT